MQEIFQWINGKDVVGQGDEISVLNPATTKEIGRLKAATPDQVATAVKAARQSFESGIWSNTSFRDRQAIMRKAAIAIRSSLDVLVDQQVAENGMIRAAVVSQVMGAAAWFDFYADQLTSDSGEIFRQLGTATTLVERVPIGVCALFSPWNVPLTLLAIKLAPALAVGNSVVVKPSENTPIVTRMFIDVVQSAGLPDGVLNYINGYGHFTGAALAAHQGIDMVSFTGGHIGGRAVAKAAAHRHVPCVMELGGKSANIIFADADMDRAVLGALVAVFGANGEACLAGSRILLEKSISEKFLERFKASAEAMRIGSPSDPTSEIGPMISARHRDAVLGFFKSAVTDGDTLLFGGAMPSNDVGYYVKPSAIHVKSTNSRIWQEEVFGPIAAVHTFTSEDDAIALANDSEFGLAGYVWTGDLDRAIRVTRKVRTGTMVVNSNFMREQNAPFGGFKSSGLGREGGVHSWLNFTEAKTTIIYHGE
jgi:acyl-CoA reductase-like NAD-dependent aldehyde dehydrogenase